ncbi:hypothetical protein Hdeb2414_s1036g00975521 [Helianthus debilis subsp. tardiflorus]
MVVFYIVSQVIFSCRTLKKSSFIYVDYRSCVGCIEVVLNLINPQWITEKKIKVHLMGSQAQTVMKGFEAQEVASKCKDLCELRVF